MKPVSVCVSLKLCSVEENKMVARLDELVNMDLLMLDVANEVDEFIFSLAHETLEDDLWTAVSFKKSTAMLYIMWVGTP